jgi:hypothetical protein
MAANNLLTKTPWADRASKAVDTSEVSKNGEVSGKLSAQKRPKTLAQSQITDTLTLIERDKEQRAWSKADATRSGSYPRKVSKCQKSSNTSIMTGKIADFEVSIPDTLLAQRTALRQLLAQTKTYIKRYVAATEEQYTILVVWVAHTYIVEHFQQTPYLWVHSAVRQSGKTRLLEVLESVVWSAWMLGRVSIAAITRGIELKGRPTLLLDELDQSMRASHDYRNNMAQILNDSCRRGRKSTLCIKGQDGEQTIGEFDVYCAKVLAGLSGESQTLPDTVEDRSIPIRMERREGQHIERFRERDKGEGERLQMAWSDFFSPDKVVEWLTAADPVMPSELSDRAQDACQALAALADLAGEEWPAKVRKALVTLTERDPETDGNLGLQLLHDIREVFNSTADNFLSSDSLVSRLRKLSDRPWKSDVNGSALSPHRLARMVGDFKIKPHSNGKLRGYRRKDFKKTFEAYLPR